MTQQPSQSSQDKIVLKISNPPVEDKVVPAKRPYKKTLKLVPNAQANEESKGGATSATEEAKLSKDHKDVLRL